MSSLSEAVVPSVTEQVERANRADATPVVFVHGLWLLASSWARWAEVFEEAGYVAVTPGWPDDPATVGEARANPDAFAGKTVGPVAAHFEEIIRGLDRTPAVVGHSFGGLLAQILAGRGLSSATVAIDPAPFRGVLPVPLSSIRSTLPILSNPLNRGKAVSLTLEQFRYGWANNLSDDEARELHETFHVPAPAAPIFQAVAANLNPVTELKVDTRNAARGPLLVIEGEKDHTIPHAVAYAQYKRQRHNEGVTEFTEIRDRGHSLTIDSGWREVADTALQFVRRFV
jgi:non-heme chloroperoxidase